MKKFKNLLIIAFSALLLNSCSKCSQTDFLENIDGGAINNEADYTNEIIESNETDENPISTEEAEKTLKEEVMADKSEPAQSEDSSNTEYESPDDNDSRQAYEDDDPEGDDELPEDYGAVEDEDE